MTGSITYPVVVAKSIGIGSASDEESISDHVPQPVMLRYGNYLYLAYNDSSQYGITIVDVSTPSSPVAYVCHYTMPTASQVKDIVLQGHYLHVLQANSHVVTLDISNPLAPVFENDLPPTGAFGNQALNPIRRLFYGGENLIFATGAESYTGQEGLATIDTTTGATPVWVNGGNVGGIYSQGYPVNIAVFGDGVLFLEETTTSGGNYSYFESWTTAAAPEGATLRVGGGSTSETATFMTYDADNKRLFVGMYYSSTGYISQDLIVDASNPSALASAGYMPTHYNSSISGYAASTGMLWHNGYLYDMLTDGNFLIYNASAAGVPALAGSVYESTLNLGYNNSASTLVASNDDNYIFIYARGSLWVVEAVADQAPNAITFDFPDPYGSEVLVNTVAQEFDWTFSDPNLGTGDSQSNADIQYWQLDANNNRIGTATQVSCAPNGTNQFYVFPAGTFATATYEFQLRTYDAQGLVGPWGPSAFYAFATPPPSPTITAPANNSTVPATVTFSWSDPNQDGFQAFVADPANPNAAIQFFNGDGSDYPKDARSVDITFPDNNVTRLLKVQILYQGLWSQAASVNVNVSFVPPTASTLTTDLIDAKGFGFPYAFSVTDHQVVQAAGNPSVTSIDVSVRETANPVATELRIAAGALPNSTVTWHAPRSNTDYEAKVRSYGDNGTYADSAWTPVVGQVTLHGVVLYAANDPDGTIKFFKFNDAGATDTLSTETVVTQYQGRQYPVVEYGDSNTYEVSVPTIQAINGSQDAFDLRALIAMKTTLCYRDRKGRKVFGAASTSQIADMRGGETTSLDITAVDYTEGV